MLLSLLRLLMAVLIQPCNKHCRLGSSGSCQVHGGIIVLMTVMQELGRRASSADGCSARLVLLRT